MPNTAMITTSNNPYNPFTQPKEWANYDEKVLGYFTRSYLARLTYDTQDMSSEATEDIIEEAIDEIVKFDLPLFDPVTGERAHYKKIYS